MSAPPSAPIEAGDWKFDLVAVGDWIIAHPVLASIVLVVAYIFWISRRDGLLGLWLEHRAKVLELETAKDLSLDQLVEALANRAESDEPRLPFDAGADRRGEEKSR